MKRMIVLAAILGVYAVYDSSQGAPPNCFSFKHHFIDMNLPVYNSPNGWLIGDYGGAAVAIPAGHYVISSALASQQNGIGAPAPRPAPILKRSRVAAWFDGPDDYRKYDADFVIQDMDIVDELEVAKWKALIERMHLQDKLFWAEMRPLTHLGKLFEHVMSDPGLQEAVCVDFNLKPIRTFWLTGLSYKGRPIYLYCSNHPRYRAFLRHQIYMFAQAGVDGIMVDDGGGTLFSYGAGGCCCKYCMAGFREFLRGKYTAEQLKARGVEDLPRFDYRQVLLKHGKDRTSLQAARQRNEVPLTAEFRDFLVRSDAELFRSLQEMACKLSGRHIPMGLVGLDTKHAIRLFPRAIPGRKGAPVVCHLVNWSYGASSNQVTPQKDLRVRLRSSIAGGSRVTNVIYHTVGKAPQTLAFAARDNLIHVTVPEVELWGILQLDTASP